MVAYLKLNDLVDDYFDSIGEDAMESMMFRQYVLVEALISGITFLDNLGVSKEKALQRYWETLRILLHMLIPLMQRQVYYKHY